MARNNDTRDRVLGTAADLFQRQGYSGTGLNQVLADSNAPKGSLYFHFPGGKEQLAAEAITRSGGEVGERLAAVVRAARGPRDALAGIAALFADNLTTTDFHSGCPIATVALEASADSEPIRASCDQAYASWLAGLSRALGHWGVAEPETEPLATLILSALQGAILLAKVRRDGTVLHTLGEQLGALVEQSIDAA
ncbi:TetR/AcrR family transcriptional regulator [Embleya sp. NPDC050154]|uniref:TetR/AcrR family transcriptional regulator n=1 Tax=unclassified Embleya TaxID=2699296 RepID=UPI0037ABAD8A